MSYVPRRGDLVWLTFDPQAGHEQAQCWALPPFWEGSCCIRASDRAHFRFATWG
jgi:hypothetical protein